MPLPSQTSLKHTQNYLQRPGLVAWLLERSSVCQEDVVYEIGPGKGIITMQLASRCKKVIAIEKDPRLASHLIRKFAGWQNVSIHEGNFLHYRLPRLPYKVFANIPFDITSAIVSRLTSANPAPEDIYLTMQAEAAGVYLGKPDETLRAVLIKPWFEPEIIHRFRRRDFKPQPGVNVVLLRLHRRKQPLVDSGDVQHYRDFVVYGFTTWRPGLRQTLKPLFSNRQLGKIFSELTISPQITPKALPFEKWLRIFEILRDISSPSTLSVISGCEKHHRQQQKKLEKVHRTRLRKHLLK
jgi:23S rRNA (adenine-N6)-dimethyltransferase